MPSRRWRPPREGGVNQEEASDAEETHESREPRADSGGRPAQERAREKMIGLVSRPAGATMGQLRKAIGMQEHSIRALISTARRSLGVEIKKDDGRYRLVGGGGAKG